MNNPTLISPHPNALAHNVPWQSAFQMWVVLALCVCSRVFTTINHIEDADSLRFALGVIDYDVTRLQPQFPGYTAFVGVVKLFYALVGSYALAFSITGGIGLFVLLHYSLAILKWRAAQPQGLFLGVLLIFNPMVWLLGNRYMSDLSGAACMLAAFYHLSRTDSQRHVLIGFFLTGILTGWRLSYAPFLIAPLVLNMILTGGTVRTRGAQLIAGCVGVAVWLVPLIVITGWDRLVATARYQTSAHFISTGGTFVTEDSWPLRIQRSISHVWTDGLGAWVPGRHPVTLLVAVGVIFLSTQFLWTLIHAKRTVLAKSGSGNDWLTWTMGNPTRLLAASAALYVVWILLFQNVIHQTRHVLPLVPPLLMLLAAGLPNGKGSGFPLFMARVITALFLIGYSITGITLARQHMQPAAIAQAKAFVETFVDSTTIIVAAPWVEKCLSAQGVKARFLSVETPKELAALPERLRALDPGTTLAAVGDYTDLIDRPLAVRRVFHHNPYVNRLGSKVEVFVYGLSNSDSP
jgi:hypothetical protein